MHAATDYPLLVLLTGSVLLLTLLLKAGLERLRLPAMVGYLLLGFGIRADRGRPRQFRLR
jgi:Kef-type K+ transport system membrane component KefB